MTSLRALYIVQTTAACCYGKYYQTHDSALCALIDGIVDGTYRAGIDHSGVFEYRLPSQFEERFFETKLEGGRFCSTTVDRRFLKRRWFFRTIGDKIGKQYRVDEDLAAAKRSRTQRCVLHVFDYQTGRLGSGAAGIARCCNSHRLTWPIRYKRLLWLCNASRAELRRAVRTALGDSSNPIALLLQSRSLLMRRLYAAGALLDTVLTERTA